MDTPDLVPYLTVTDARAAIEFYRVAFEATLVEGELFEMDDGRIGHASLSVGEGLLYLSDEFPEMGVVAPETVGGSTMALVIKVADADETYDRAVAAGGRAQRPVQNQNGARSGWLLDPWGHRWSPTGPEKLDE